MNVKVYRDWKERKVRYHDDYGEDDSGYEEELSNKAGIRREIKEINNLEELSQEINNADGHMDEDGSGSIGTLLITTANDELIYDRREGESPKEAEDIAKERFESLMGNERERMKA